MARLPHPNQRALAEMGRDLVAQGMSLSDAAAQVARAAGRRVHPSTLRLWIKQLGAMATAAPNPSPPAPAPPPSAEPLVDRLRGLVRALQLADLILEATLVTEAIATIIAAQVASAVVETPDDPTPPNDAPLLDTLRWQYRENNRRAAEADRCGNSTAAQRYRKTAADVSNYIARVERFTRDDGDAVRCTRAEIAAARVTLAERIQAIATQPLTCAKCGVALRVAQTEES